jgi:hypothetical protein
MADYIFFDNIGRRFVWNVDTLLPDYTMPVPCRLVFNVSAVVTWNLTLVFVKPWASPWNAGNFSKWWETAGGLSPSLCSRTVPLLNFITQFTSVRLSSLYQLPLSVHTYHFISVPVHPLIPLSRSRKLWQGAVVVVFRTLVFVICNMTVGAQHVMLHAATLSHDVASSVRPSVRYTNAYYLRISGTHFPSWYWIISIFFSSDL